MEPLGFLMNIYTERLDQSNDKAANFVFLLIQTRGPQKHNRKPQYINLEWNKCW